MKLYTLPNGITVVTYRLPDVKSVHVSVYAKGGSVVENPQRNGLAHFMEHMLLQGTPTYPTSQEIVLYLEKLAGRYNAFTSDLLVSFYVTLPYIHADKAIQFADEIWFSSTFPKSALEKERRAVLTEAVQRLDSLHYKLDMFYRKNRYVASSKLQQQTIGLPESIEKVTDTDIRGYWQEFFTTENTYVLVLGNFEEATMEALIKKYFGVHKKTNQHSLFTHLSPDNFAEKGVFVRQDKTLQTNYFEISLPALDSLSPRKDILAQNLALIILGQLQSSRLIKTLRYDKGLVYGVSAHGSRYPHVGEVSFASEMRDDQYKEVATLMTDIIIKFISEGPTDEEMKHAKSYITNQILMAFDEPSDIANWLAADFLWREKVLMPEEVIVLIESLTKDDLMHIMHSKWDFSKTQIISQGPLAETKEFRGFLDNLLQQFLTLAKK